MFSAQGERVAQEFQETSVILLPGGGAEQDPADWWNAIEAALKRLLAKGLVPLENIAAIGVTAQWSGTAAVGRDGEPLANAVIWMDSRGAPFIQKISAGFPMVEGYALHKALNWIRLTGGAPGRAGKDPLAHILYLKETRPELYARAYKFLEPVDYIGLRLTGQFAASFNSITLHWVTDNRDIQAVKYHDGLLRLAGIEREKLPDLKPANALLGTLHPQVAHEWGLRDDVKVFMGSPDVHSAAVGSGAARDYEPHLYIGTSSWLVCHVPFKKTDLVHNIASLPSAIPGRYLLTNEQELAGGCLQYLRDELFFAQDELSSGFKPTDVYQRMDKMAQRAPAGSGRLLFLPWLYGERSPVENHLLRGGFYNLSLNSSRAEIVRSVFEGVAYNARWLLTYVEKFIRRPADSINMVGGGAKSNVWCQICADVLNRPVRQMTDPIEANLRGAALLAAVGMGYLRYDEIGLRVKAANVYQPNPAHRKIYDEMFREFLAAYENSRKASARLNRGG